MLLDTQSRPSDNQFGGLMRLFFIAVCCVSLSLETFAQGLVNGSLNSHPLTLTEAVEAISDSIVHVDETYSFQIQGEPSPRISNSSGTGFIVDSQGDIATANHVVDPPRIQADLERQLAGAQQTLVPGSFRVLNLSVSVQVPNQEQDDHGNTIYNVRRGTFATLLRQDSRLDIAILSCRDNLITASPGLILNGERMDPALTLPVFQEESPRSGDQVAVTGFPWIKASATTNLPIPGLTTNTGTVANASFVLDDRFVYLADMHVNSGDSGGPVYNNPDGRIIGFVDAYLNATEGGNSGLTVIVPIRQVLMVLAQR
jgi:S1-C subfamily serine protease